MKTYSYAGRQAELESMIVHPNGMLVYAIKVGDALIRTCLLDKRFRIHSTPPRKQLVRA